MKNWTTKVTNVGGNFICQISLDNKPYCQSVVKERHNIGNAFVTMFRDIDKFTSKGDVYTDRIRSKVLNKEGNSYIYKLKIQYF